MEIKLEEDVYLTKADIKDIDIEAKINFTFYPFDLPDEQYRELAKGMVSEFFFMIYKGDITVGDSWANVDGSIVDIVEDFYRECVELNDKADLEYVGYYEVLAKFKKCVEILEKVK